MTIKFQLELFVLFLYHTSSLMHRDGSSVMFPLGSCGVSGLATSDPPCPNDPVGIDLTPTPIPAAKLHIHTRQMTTEMALSLLILNRSINIIMDSCHNRNPMSLHVILYIPII